MTNTIIIKGQFERYILLSALEAYADGWCENLAALEKSLVKDDDSELLDAKLKILTARQISDRL